MKKSRIRKQFRDFTSALERHGIAFHQDHIIKVYPITPDHEYPIAVSYKPSNKNLDIQIKSIKDTLDSKFRNIQGLIETCKSNFPDIADKELLDTLSRYDFHNTTFKRIKREVIADLERRAIDLELDRTYVSDYPEIFPLAYGHRRKVVALLGDTNSGKTHTAIQYIAKSRKAAYLAPLRLLALENYDSLNDQGIVTSLITGEEKIIHDNHQCVSATVECFNTNTHYDTVVIDEIQMIDDPDRGWAFVQALVGAYSDVIVVTGPLEYGPRLKALVGRLRLDYEEYCFTRKTTLKMMSKPVSIKNVKKRSAIVVFSRKQIFEVRKQLPKGVKASVIYGALGSEVRKRQAEMYVNGDTDVLITTDAIGMGLNLPIENIIFTTHVKYNGRNKTALGTMLTKQIAGRAGRYGMFDVGYVGATDAETLQYVKSCLSQKLDVRQEQFRVQPTPEHIIGLLDRFGLSTILEDWTENTRFPSDSMFVHDDMKNKIEIARFLEKRYPHKVKEYFRLINCPVDFSKEYPVFRQYVKQMFDDREYSIPPVNIQTLDVPQLECYVRELLLLKWFVNQFDEFCANTTQFVNHVNAVLEETNDLLHKRLSK